MTKLEDFKEDQESESFWSEDYKYVKDASDQNCGDSEVDSDIWYQHRLFIGIIDINKWEEDAQALYKKLLEEGDRFSTQFWCGVRTVEEKANSIYLPTTIEELKEAEKIYYDVNQALRSYNEFISRNQYFKPHTANAKKFLNNTDFISRQIRLYNTNKECINSFLGIEEKEFSKLLNYYSKPREISIKFFKEKQADKARFDSGITEELQKFIKTKARQWI